jgi:MFS family permease
VLVLVGLWVRLRISETPAFQKTLDHEERVRLPMLSVVRDHTRALLLGTVIALATFVLFYLMTVFTLTWGTTALGYSREEFLVLQLVGIVFFGLTIPFSALYADRHGRRRTLLWVSAAIAVFGLVLAPLLQAGTFGVLATLIVGLALMGYTYGPLGTILSEMYPTAVRYTGSSLSFNLAGIFGASLAPYIATWLARNHGLEFVGYYLSAAALLSFAAMWATRETRDVDFTGPAMSGSA